MSKLLKEKGNAFYKQHLFTEAISCYSEAVSTEKNRNSETETSILSDLYNNTAQCFLKLQKYQEALEATSQCLQLSPDNIKALFRRSQALRHLGQLQEAHDDATKLMEMEPCNGAIKNLLDRPTMTDSNFS